jgi:hypothetical protein
MSDQGILEAESRVKKLVDQGLDVRKIFATHHFFDPSSSVHAFFNHVNYGLRNEKSAPQVDSAFYDHVRGERDPPRWFRGRLRVGDEEKKPKVRAQERELVLRNDLFRGEAPRSFERVLEDFKYHQGLTLAHDMVIRKDPESSSNLREGGPKMFLLASPWQALYRISRKRHDDDVSKEVGKLSTVVAPRSSRFERAWGEEGQPVKNWPACSLYNYRYDELAEVGSREYFFTLDVDGANAVPPHSPSTESIEEYRTRCSVVMDDFERGQEPLLLELTAGIREAFSEITTKPVGVAWHKTIGWKPSWRAYVVGVVFRDIQYAKHFARNVLSEKCDPIIRRRYPSTDEAQMERIGGVMDVGNTYDVGFDRCLGMAKLMSDDPRSMRFLEVKPMERFTDKRLIDTFNRCPNEYILSVLGWIYPRVFDQRDPAELFLDYAQSLKSGKRERNDRPGGSKARPGQKRRGEETLDGKVAGKIAALIADAMRDRGFEEDWEGEDAKAGTDARGEYVEMFSAGKNPRFCAYRCFGIAKKERNEPPTKGRDMSAVKSHRKHGAGNSERKIMFRVYLDRDDRDGKYWVRQNCHKCGGTSYRLQYVCAIEPPGGDLRRYLSEATDDAPTQPSSKTDVFSALEEFGFGLCVEIDGVVREMDALFAKTPGVNTPN